MLREIQRLADRLEYRRANPLPDPKANAMSLGLIRNALRRHLKAAGVGLPQKTTTEEHDRRLIALARQVAGNGGVRVEAPQGGSRTKV